MTITFYCFSFIHLRKKVFYWVACVIGVSHVDHFTTVCMSMGLWHWNKCLAGKSRQYMFLWTFQLIMKAANAQNVNELERATKPSAWCLHVQMWKGKVVLQSNRNDMKIHIYCLENNKTEEKRHFKTSCFKYFWRCFI